jgi:hypothetical protein
MRRRVLWIGLLLAVFVGPLPATASPAPYATITELIDAADLIVVGRLVPLGGHANTGTPEAVSAVVVDRVLKGTLPIGAKMIAVPAGLRLGWWSIRKYGIFFLRPDQGSQYSEAIPGLSSIFALPNTAAPAPGTDPLLAVTVEQVAVLAEPASTLTQVAASPGMVPNPPPIRRAEFSYDDASRIVEQAPVTMARPLLEAALQSDSDVLSRCWIMRTLISIGVPVDLQSIMPFLRDPSPETEKTRADLASSLYRADPPAEMTPSIIELLGLSDVVLRRGAAHALRDIKTAASTRALALIALRDNDAHVRTDAEQGLCWAMKVRTSPCDVPAEQDEEAQRAYWTEWAKAAYK